MKYLKVLNPCHMKYDDMQKVDNASRFCGECDKKVYDFTNSSMGEFMEIYEANDGNVCGQIKVPKTLPIVAAKSPFGARWAAFFVSLISFIGLSTSSCKSNEQNVQGDVVPEERPIDENVGNVKSEMVVGKMSSEAFPDSTEIE